MFFLNYIQMYCVCNNTINIDKIIDTCVYANFQARIIVQMKTRARYSVDKKGYDVFT